MLKKSSKELNKPLHLKSNLLIIFTRNPELGKVKTRLAKDVGDNAALNIYKFLLQHTVSVTKDLDLSKEVYYSEEIRDTDIWDNSYFSKKLQQGSELGERMQNAFKTGFQNGFKNIIIIGSDLYDLKTSDIKTAFSLLENKDAVIGPATDGGYYLLGMSKLYPEVFQQKKWGTSSVLEETLKDLKGKNIALLEERNDVDYYSDIKEHEDFQKFF